MRLLIRWIASVLVTVACVSCGVRDMVPEASQPVPEIYVAIDESPTGFREAALDVSKKRLAGLGVTFEQSEGTASALALTLHLTYRNLTPSEFETIWGMTTFFLATLYPSTCAHRTYSLTADLIDASGHSRAYEQTDTTVAWLWLFNGPRCGETPSEGEIESMTHRLLDGIYDRIQRDGAFSGLALADIATAPVVRISTNRAAAIAEQVLRVDRPFDRWTMVDDPAAPPEYQADLFFEVRPGTFSIPKAYLAIMTLGLSGVCNSTPITLIATFTGPRIAKTKSYERSKSVRGHMGANGSDCEVQDERTRPEVFAALLRQVFAQAVRDKVIAASTQPVDTSRFAPLVRVIGDGAEGIVRRETIRSSPFPRYLFDPAAGYPIDYSLALEFAFTGGGTKPTGVAGQIGQGLAIAWLGRYSGCEPTTMGLTAALTDRQGAEVARYQITHTVRTTGRFDAKALCRDDENTNPGAVTDLVRSLYAKLRADGTLRKLNLPPPQ